MKIAYFPFSCSTNKYIEISQNCLRGMGHEIVSFENDEKANIAWLNWFESINGRNPFRLWGSIQKRLDKLRALKDRGTKIVFTFHNKRPHEINPLSQRLVVWYLKQIIKLSDKIVCLSKDSIRFLRDYLPQTEIDKKAVYIPHPNYIGAYEPVCEGQAPGSSTNFRILFAGMIRPYKNVELIIKAAAALKDKNVEFIIAGDCTDKYRKKLLAMSRNLPITFQFHFLKDAELTELMKHNDILLLPYSLKSSTNSGTIYLACSNARTVIAPKICSVKEFPEDLMYSYEYSSKKEHLRAMITQIEKAYVDWQKDLDRFYQKGLKLFEIVKQENSQEVVQKKYKELLECLK